MKKTEIILSEIAEGDPIKVLNILKENKNSKLKYQCSYEDHLFQLKSDKESEVDGPFSYIDDVIEYNKDVNSLFLENNKYESAVDVFNNWETPELETYAGGNFNSKKPVYWGDCFICATGCLDIEDLILKLSEFISSEDEEDEEFRDEGFYWFLDSLDIISDPEEFHVGFEDNDIRVSNIKYSAGTELGINNISFYSTNNMVHSDYEFMIEILNQSNEKDMVSKNDEIENITEEPKVNSNMKKSTYDNGNILEEWEVNEKGQRHGLMKRYHENGQLQVEVTWTNGIQDDSEIISYHDDGSKARQVTRVNSSLNGEFFEWYKNGQLKKQGVYNEDVSTIHKEWDENGVNLISNIKEESKENIEYNLKNNKMNDNGTIRMLVTFPNTIFSEHPNTSFLIEKCDNSSSDFVNISNNCIKGEFEIPAELKNHIEVLKYDIDTSEAFSNGNNYLTMDIDCTVTLSIKTTKDEAIDAIEKYQEDNDDLRWSLSIKWIDTDNKEQYSFDSWDEDMLEEIIEDEPCWYEED